jgi:hypothetical protein
MKLLSLRQDNALVQRRPFETGNGLVIRKEEILLTKLLSL